MDFYGLLERLVYNTQMPEPDRQAAKEIIKSLKGVNAFGTVIAATVSESKETPHVHDRETRWDDLNAGKLVDVCRICDERLTEPYDGSNLHRKEMINAHSRSYPSRT